MIIINKGIEFEIKYTELNHYEKALFTYDVMCDLLNHIVSNNEGSIREEIAHFPYSYANIESGTLHHGEIVIKYFYSRGGKLVTPTQIYIS